MPVLKLSEAVAEADRSLDDYRELPDKAEKHVASLGIRLPEQPMVRGEPFVPKIPIGPDGTPALSHLSHKELSDLNVQFLAYHDYVGTQLKLHKIQLNTCAKVFDSLKRRVRMLHSGSPTEKSDLTMADPRVRDAELDLLESDSRHALIEGIMDAVVRDMKVISRDVTIREQEAFGFKRDRSIQNKKYPVHRKNFGEDAFGLDEQEDDSEFLKSKGKESKGGKRNKPKKE